MAKLCTSIGWFLSIVSLVGILVVISSKHWKENNRADSIAAASNILSYEGLWVRCVSSIPGQFQCDNFDESFINLPAPLQFQRAMMVIASLSAVIGVIAAALGMDCITAMGDSNRSKVYTGRSGGGLILLSGVLTLASVSWYAAVVVQEFHKQQLTGATFVYEFGSALYVGWITSVLAIIAGFLLLCCNCGGNEESDDYPYNYGHAAAAPTKRANTEYV